MKDELFKKVYIKSEADLPKDKKNKYWVKHSNSNRLYFSKPSKLWVVNDAEYYLQPIDQSSLSPDKERVIEVLNKHTQLMRVNRAGEARMGIDKRDFELVADELSLLKEKLLKSRIKPRKHFDER